MTIHSFRGTLPCPRSNALLLPLVLYHIGCVSKINQYISPHKVIIIIAIIVSTHTLKYLETIVVTVTNINKTIPVHCYSTRLNKLSRFHSRGSKRSQEVTITGEQWNTMVILLTDIHYIIGVNGDTSGPSQFPITFTFLPKPPQEVSVFCKDLDTIVHNITDVHIPYAIKHNIPGVLELTFGTALAAVECQVSIQDLNSVIRTVTYIYPVPLTDANTHRTTRNTTTKLQRSIALFTYWCEELSVCCELLNTSTSMFPSLSIAVRTTGLTMTWATWMSWSSLLLDQIWRYNVHHTQLLQSVHSHRQLHPRGPWDHQWFWWECQVLQ